jgi:hypothetical protein
LRTALAVHRNPSDISFPMGLAERGKALSHAFVRAAPIWTLRVPSA